MYLSSKISKKKYQDNIKLKITEERIVGLEKAIISFSKLTGFPHTAFVYTGNEVIPFKDTHPVYQTILRNEFAEAIRKSVKERKRVLNLL